MARVPAHIALEHELSRLAYTDAEVGSLLGISKRTVYRMRKAEVLRSVSIGRAIRIPAEEISRLLSAGFQQTKQERKENEGAGQSPSVQPQS